MTSTSLVAGVDSSTQSCTVVVADAATGAVVRSGSAPHPPGTEVDPDAWWQALCSAISDAGGVADVGAISVAGQQHGMVLLDEDGRVVRPALLWNDTRSAPAAAELVAELGPDAWAEACGSVPVASFTVTKLRWVAEHEPAAAGRAAAVCLPHDWLTWRLGGSGDIGRLTTDRGDASGTGYWSPTVGAYRTDLLSRAFGRSLEVPRVLGPAEASGAVASDGSAPGAILAPGTGDNMAAALGLGTAVGETVVSIGTSGVVTSCSTVPVADPSGTVAGFADATGRYLPLVCTLNGAPVLDTVAALLGVDHDGFDRLALSAEPGAGGLTLVPYLGGERTPNRPDATGSVLGATYHNLTPANLARAAVEGMLGGLAVGLEALAGVGVTLDGVVLTGGGARSAAVRAVAPEVFGRPVRVAEPVAAVALGAARQAAWVLAGGAEPPTWPARPRGQGS